MGFEGFGPPLFECRGLGALGLYRGFRFFGGLRVYIFRVLGF